jgi:phenylacetate-CoA ligase
MPAPPQPARAALRRRQLERLRALLPVLRDGNRFQQVKLAGLGANAWTVASLEDFTARFPFTTKAELAADQRAHPPYGTNLSHPLDRYTRCHQTSGTAGAPIRWLDTPESWDALTAGWMEVLRAAGVGSDDRVFFAFSFGPFIGFWMAFAAAERLGCLCLSGGGMTSVARLHALREHAATVLCCTPTYALHLAEAAEREGIAPGSLAVRRLLVAGEPGGSVPATRARLEADWPGARVFDHHGMTEVGAVTYECPAQPGVLHVLEETYFAEVLDPARGVPVEAGERGELVLTPLHRAGSPLLRYRTGDWVQPRFAPGAEAVAPCACGRSELALVGGILGRVDDMVIVRGVNVYPSALDELVRRFPEVVEYQVLVTQPGGLAELNLELEPRPDCPEPAGLAARVQQALQTALSLRVPVTFVPPGTLPRYELKARRWVRLDRPRPR